MSDVHTKDNPYCSDPDCWCATDWVYHQSVTEFDPEADVDEELYGKALGFLLESDEEGEE
ncbi:MAG: hypothetical protein J2P36_23585 [Ktedonobacteraceae bacterium]|nr:hypothetical protein [Ktedonobacteraceae bacterium]